VTSRVFPAAGGGAHAARVRQELLAGAGAGTAGSSGAGAAALAAAVHRTSLPSGGAAALSAVEAARRELVGAGALEPLLADPGVTDVLVNGPHEVWVERDGLLSRVELSLGHEDDVRRLAVRLAAAAGRRLDDAAPFVDVRLPDGSRLHAVLPPVSPSGTLLSIRVLRHRALSLDDLVGSGSLDPRLGTLLRCLIAARLSVVVTGGTGTGKTTLLGALLDLVPAAERLVVAEDACELRTHHEHVVRLECRTANVEGAGEVSLRDLVRQALRMRPDRLIVGEARGAEIVDLLTALNVGSEGGLTTLHANSAADLPARLAALAALAGMAPGAIEPLAAAGLHAVVHLRRRGGRREVAEVATVGLLRSTSGRADLQVRLALAPGGVVGCGGPALLQSLRECGVEPPAELATALATALEQAPGAL
jgi:pilus assembly protein CpaF